MCTISSNSFHSQVSSLFIRSLIEAHIISKRLIAKGTFHLNSFVSFEPPEVHYFSNTHVMNAMLHTVCVIQVRKGMCVDRNGFFVVVINTSIELGFGEYQRCNSTCQNLKSLKIKVGIMYFNGKIITSIEPYLTHAERNYRRFSSSSWKQHRIIEAIQSTS